MNVWHLLAVHIPNLLPRTFLALHVPWLRKAARLIYAIVLSLIGCIAAGRWSSERRSRPSPRRGRRRARRDVRVVHVRARLRRDPARVADVRQLVPELRQRVVPLAQEPHPSVRDHTRQADRHRRGGDLRGRARHRTSSFFAAWQKRKVAEPAAEGAEIAETESTARSPAARSSRACAATSAPRAYGRPVTTSES